jgi:RNA polymerase sigma-70 factor (ECF subfamily)
VLSSAILRRLERSARSRALPSIDVKPPPEGPRPSSTHEDPGLWIVRIGTERDRRCFAALFQAFAPKMKSYFLRFGVEDGVAEDLAQETLLAVWRKAALFDPTRASAAGWLFTIARNLRIDALRRERHPDDFRIAPPAEPPRTPEEILRDRESDTRLHAALATLPPDQAQVVRLAYLDDHSHTEIAQELGLPLGTVKSRIRLAAVQLRSAMDSLD